jgi:hypothetical protein
MAGGLAYRRRAFTVFMPFLCGGTACGRSLALLCCREGAVVAELQDADAGDAAPGVGCGDGCGLPTGELADFIQLQAFSNVCRQQQSASSRFKCRAGVFSDLLPGSPLNFLCALRYHHLASSTCLSVPATRHDLRHLPFFRCVRYVAVQPILQPVALALLAGRGLLAGLRRNAGRCGLARRTVATSTRETSAYHAVYSRIIYL